VASGAIITRRNGKVAVVGNCIGRTHREGQDADDVLVEVPFWDGIALSYLTAARDDAAYVQQSTGQQQKLLLASFYSQSSET
jgi:hypothetical protein